MLALTSEQEIVCIDTWDKQFILARAFPKEKSYIFFDNLSYMSSVLVRKRDSFEVFPSPVLAEMKAAGSATKQQFIYDVVKLTVKSHFKMSVASHNEQTQTLKLLVQENKKAIERKLEMIGIVASGGTSQAPEVSDVSEVI